ncbi:filamentous hemagglutinin N-terminal domain-containing protein [Burkholderia sp. BCC0044]|uniref:two-partner secretion domain-containing protein n=1 Tax=Burkholderia sp. BCC0044 TaxID=2676295 RepID=UPI001589DD14|nr:filamentous hemagglutinin N-terminal domain-containing protein [Burkholderia sp. BCC0044]
MNKTYALVWNQTQGCWSAVGETARRRGKSAGGKRLAAAAVSLLGFASVPAFALPTGEAITAGKADILRDADGKSMSINQHTDKLVTNWQAFDVAAGERVAFKQPGSQSIALNRVIGNNGSQIHGNIDANGKVFLVNPNGVLFGSGAQINVGGLVASTQNLIDADFLAGNYRFAGQSNASIVNDGKITAADGGSVALLGARVSNNGVIQAKMGLVALGAGNAFNVNFDGNDLLSLQVDEGAIDAQATNGGLLKADGGEVLMSARAAGDLLNAVVNNTGTIEAKGLVGRGGRITLDGDTVKVAGTLDASSDSGRDGQVLTQGRTIFISSDASVDTRGANGQTGTWKIDTDSIDVSDSGAVGTISATALSRNLETSNVDLSSGLIKISDDISWTSDNALSLTSFGYTDLWGKMLATGTNASLTVNAYYVRVNDAVKFTDRNAHIELNTKGLWFMHDRAALMLSGDNASFHWNGENYQVLHTLDDLRNIDANLKGRYVLGNAIDGAGADFRSIGNHSSFSGVFNGLGNTISRLNISNPGYNTVGLFATNTGNIASINLRNIVTSTLGQPYSPPASVGTLAGYNAGVISNVTATDVTVATQDRMIAGGLVGYNQGNISSSKTAANVVTGSGSMAGGAVGYNRGNIDNSAASGNVIAGTDSVAGGLVGHNDKMGRVGGKTESNVTVADKSTAGGFVGVNDGFVAGVVDANVAGKNESTVGGLAGRNTGEIRWSTVGGNISGGIGSIVGGSVGENSGYLNSRNRSNVQAELGSKVGGSVGRNTGHIYGALAGGELSTGAQSIAGGLVGENFGGTIDDSYAWGNVKGNDYSFVGGLVGHNSGTVIRSLSEGTVSGGRFAMLGGLVGANFGSISNSSANGRVETVAGYGQIAGPLVGLNAGQVKN